MANRKTQRHLRTMSIIRSFHGLPNEFYLLKGVLIASNGWSYDEVRRFTALIDTTLIATRMDEMNNEARARMQAELDGIRESAGSGT